MRIAVLGSTGQVGSCITAQLKKDFPGAEILACARKQMPEHFTFDPFGDDWAKLGKVDVVVNAIGIIEEKKGLTFEKVHRGVTRLMLENRQKTGDPRLLQVSVLGANVNSKAAFMYTKALADEELLKAGNSAVIRPSIVCTHNTVIVQKFKMVKSISRLMMGFLPFPAAMLHTKMQPVMGEDVAAVVSTLCKGSYNGVVNTVGPGILTVADLLGFLPGRIRFIKMGRAISDPIIKLAMKLIPSLINDAQYELLFKDNIADKAEAEKMLNRTMTDTTPFWVSELSEN